MLETVQKKKSQSSSSEDESDKEGDYEKKGTQVKNIDDIKSKLKKPAEKEKKTTKIVDESDEKASKT